uniref:Caspase recruitment domain family member 10 n=1 Tax=Sphenodon punctatus TaxID=8508 RepID=A0A8D0H550_SPHPU
REEEVTLWEKIESVRHQLTRSLNPAKLTPYLRQCRVIDEQDEEELLSSYRYPCKSNRTGHLMDILRGRGKRGYEAFLESLEFYYPEHFTRLTGREPAQRCSMILDEEGPEGLTQFLMMEVKKVRNQRKGHLAKEHQLQAKNRALEEEQGQLEQQLQEMRKVQGRCQRLQEEWDSSSTELLRLKDENYMLAMRYAQLCEEKNAAVLRSRDLQLVVDQLKCKASSLEEECSLLRKQASAAPQRDAEERSHSDTVSKLSAENQRLATSLQELQSMMQAASEAQVPGSERILLDILEHDRKEAQADRQELCQKLHAVQTELQWAEELRDKYLQEVEDLQLKHRTVQKDCNLYKHRMNTVLSQLEEIEKERDQAIRSRDGVQLQYSQSMIEKDQYRKRVRALEEERDELLSKLTQAEGVNSTLEAQLQRCHGNRGLGKKMCCSSYSLCSILSSSWSLLDTPSFLGNGAVDTLATPDNEKAINRLSTFPFPPCAGSILRRQQEDGLISLVVQLSTMSYLSNPMPQDQGLGGEISIIGGNRTGIYVQRVKPGSEAEGAGLREGCRLLEAILLMQPLKKALDERKNVSGDSFYVRANLTLSEQADPYSLCVRCREILHVTDTMYKGQLEWYCARVDPLTLRDLDKGTVPNYSSLLCSWSLLHPIPLLFVPFPHSPQLKIRALDQLRLVKPKQQGDRGERTQEVLLDPCPDRSPNPYSLVRPLVLETRRPVVLSPDCVAPKLIRKLLDLPSSRLDFHLCPAGELSPPATTGFTVSNKHCLLELGVQGVRDLIKREIYPIVIHVEVTEKNVRGARSLLQKPGRRDSDVLKQCRKAEQALHSLPCSWACVEPQSWGHAEELVKLVRGRIFQQQTRAVWVEEREM